MAPTSRFLVTVCNCRAILFVSITFSTCSEEVVCAYAFRCPSRNSITNSKDKPVTLFLSSLATLIQLSRDIACSGRPCWQTLALLFTKIWWGSMTGSIISLSYPAGCAYHYSMTRLFDPTTSIHEPGWKYDELFQSSSLLLIILLAYIIRRGRMRCLEMYLFVITFNFGMVLALFLL